MSFLEVSNLSKFYSVGGARLEVLKNLELAVEVGEMVAIVGTSGVGKSTLMHVMGGLDRRDGGLIRVGETEITALTDTELVTFRNKYVGFVFQFHHLLPEFSALENTEMPMRIAGVPLAEARKRAQDLLEQVGLTDRISHRPGLLSGGEQQRVAIARALVMRPSLLLADEPTGDLDRQTGEILHRLLREIHKQHGLTSVIATHNLRLAESCDRVFKLENGCLQPAESM